MDSDTTINTVQEYRLAMLAAIDKNERLFKASWEADESDRLLQLVDLVLEKMRVGAWLNLLLKLRGVPYMNLEARIQKKKNDIRRIECEREKRLEESSYFPTSRKISEAEVTDVLEMIRNCLKFVKLSS